MTDPRPATRTAARRPRSGAALARLVAGVAAVTVVAAATGFWFVRSPGTAGRGDAGLPVPAPGGAKTPAVGGVPQFGDWPAGKPDVALLLTGQTFGYLSPCGCSRPQKGGLERRYNYAESLRKKGWPVVGLDLGDVAPAKGLAQQNQLKYRFTMKALAAIGYAAVGVGEYDFHNQLFTLLAEYALQQPGKPPVVLAANLLGAQRGADGKPTRLFSREEFFPTGGPRPAVEAVEVTGGGVPVGVVGVVGKEVADKARKLDPAFEFADNGETIRAALAKLDAHPSKPTLRVLLYAGPLALAREAAKAFPQFQLVVCQSEESEPPMFPTAANDGRTLIVQVGHKGQNLGVVGAFKRSDGGFDLKYQLVPLGEEYLTPTDPDPAKNAEIEKAHPVLRILEEYTAAVRDQNLLAAARVKPLQHPAQITHPKDNLTYVGAEVCAKCHAAEFQVWKGSKHSHAYEALADPKYANRPGLRQFDPECLVCHTTGFEYVGGFDNADKTAHLKHNGCENCHGPGSGHVARPFDKALYPSLMTWKSDPKVRMPDKAKLEKLASLKSKPLERSQATGSLLSADEVRYVNAVSTMCMKCHDGENDPKFDVYEYFPKIAHSGLKAAGLPPGAK